MKQEDEDHICGKVISLLGFSIVIGMLVLMGYYMANLAISLLKMM